MTSLCWASHTPVQVLRVVAHAVDHVAAREVLGYAVLQRAAEVPSINLSLLDFER